MPHALFVFAHQDDEIAAASRIAWTLGRGCTVSCAFLTNGEGGKASSQERDAESRVVLARLGVDPRRVHFLGSEHGLPDGALVRHLERALEVLEARIAEPVDELTCLAWEGGHHDHDASHLVAVAFAKRRGILDRCVEVPLYQGHRLPLGIFDTLAPLRAGAPWNGRRITVREGLRIAGLCRFYPTQRKTWMGLLPLALLRLVLGRREWTRPVDLARLRAQPHPGTLFYERRFGVRWSDFARHAEPFIARLDAGITRS
jgi:LmbE family N-acetylglucosaminyl deacetylase